MNFTLSRNSPNLEGKWVRRGLLILLLIWVLLLTAFGARYAPAGTLEIRVKDHREAIGDFAKLELMVDTIRVARRSALGLSRSRWIVIQPSVKRVDLTKFTGGKAALIFSGEVKPASFEAFDLRLGSVEGMLKKKPGKVAVRSIVGPIRILFSVQQEGKTAVVLDFVVIDRSDHPGQSYELHVKGYELYIDDKLINREP